MISVAALILSVLQMLCEATLQIGDDKSCMLIRSQQCGLSTLAFKPPRNLTIKSYTDSPISWKAKQMCPWCSNQSIMCIQPLETKFV